MEIKTVENIQTLADLSRAVEYYRRIAEEISRLSLSKDIAKEAILEQFRNTKMRTFDTDSGLRARTDIREGNRYINVKEAEALLDKDTFKKLVRQGDPIVVLSVRPIKAEE